MSTMPVAPEPTVKEFARLLAENNEDAVPFYRADGREVLVEVWNKGHKYIYRYEAGEKSGHFFKFHDWEAVQ